VVAGRIVKTGDPDPNLAANTRQEFPDWRLVSAEVGALPGDPEAKCYVYVWEELDPAGETRVGKLTMILGEDGRDYWEGVSWQFITNPGTGAANVFSPGVRNVTVAQNDGGAFASPPNWGEGGAAVLASVNAVNDGGIRRITRRYAVAPVRMSTGDELRYNGRLEIYTESMVGAMPAAPAGFVVVDTQVASASGLPVYTRTFARGAGEISRDRQEKNNGKLVVISVRALSGPEVGANPIAVDAGFVGIDSGMQEDSGYRVWSRTFARGSGEVSRDRQERNNGKLVVIAVRALSGPEVGANPIAVDAGFAGIDSGMQEDSGYRVWSRVFARGAGEVSRDVELHNNGKLTVWAIRALTAPDAESHGVEPPVADAVLVASGKSEAEGHRMWTVRFARGSGVISRVQSAGPNIIPDSVVHEWRLLKVAADLPGEFSLAGGGIPGLVTSVMEECAEGHDVRVVKSIASKSGGSVVGSKVVTYGMHRVTRFGTVSTGTFSFEGGSIVYPKLSPPTTRTVSVRIETEVMSAPPDAAFVPAFNVDGLACGLTSIQRSHRYAGYGRTTSGARSAVSVTAWAETARVSSEELRGYIRRDAGGEGGFEYASHVTVSPGGGIVSTLYNTERSAIVLDGPTSALAVAVGDVIDREVQPIVLGADGTTVYLVRTYFSNESQAAQ
jgi:hypothetical protein